MKIFSTWPKYFDQYFSESLKFADFKNVLRFFISSYDQVTALQSRQKWPKTGKNRQNGPTLEGCNFSLKQDMKNLDTYLKSAKFKVSEKYNLKYFGQVKIIFIFFIFIFHFQIL